MVTFGVIPVFLRDRSLREQELCGRGYGGHDGQSGEAGTDESGDF